MVRVISVVQLRFVQRVREPARCSERVAGCGSPRSVLIVVVRAGDVHHAPCAKAKVLSPKLKRSKFGFRLEWKLDRESEFRQKVRVDGWVRPPVIYTLSPMWDSTSTSLAKVTTFM